MKLLQVPHWDEQCPARIPNPAPRGTHVGRGVVEHSLRGYIHLLLEKHRSQPGGQLEWGGHLTEVAVLLLPPADAISSTAQPSCKGQRVHEQPGPLLPLRKVAVCPLPADACPFSEPTSLPAVPALSPAHTGTWGPSSHPPVARHPVILFPNMAMSFSLNHPQNCSWDFRNASFHCVCSIVLPGGAAGLRASCCTLAMGEQARWTS